MKRPRDWWEVRRARRWGSECMTYVPFRVDAETYARQDIARHGNVGRIIKIDRNTRTLYYDVYEEES